VFVFCVTQVTALLHGHMDVVSAASALLVFWLVWWAWTQFTWALNAADTTHHQVELGTLVATAIAFFMAVAVPDAFGDRALGFAIAYVAVRSLGLGLYGRVAAANPGQHMAVRTFASVSIGGLAAVLVGGIVGGQTQYWLWGLAILLDVIAAAVGGQSEDWDLHPEHFAERHGLFVIIALGESLIVAAGGVSGAVWDRDMLAIAVLAVAITSSFWWTYFARAKPALDSALEARAGSARSMMARDVFSLTHFPLLCGIVGYAVAIEHAVAHPSEPLDFAARVALALGVLLFVGGMAIAVWQSTGRLLAARVIVTVVTAATIVFVSGVHAPITLGIAFVGAAGIAVWEQRHSVYPPGETGGLRSP
jgi:low temperature requirement protein LtrA